MTYEQVRNQLANLHNYVDSRFNDVQDQLDRIEAKVDDMTTGQENLDTDLQALLAEVGDLATQVATALNKPSVDLGPEDATVKDAITRLQAIGASVTPTA